MQAESQEEAVAKAKAYVQANPTATQPSRTMKVQIHGMHCASCEVLVERKFKKIEGVEKVNVNHANGKADLICSHEPNIRQLNNLVREDGYQVTFWDDRNSG